MRILAVVPEYPPHSGGGVLLYYHELLPALARAGARVEVLVAAPFSPPVTEYEADGVLVRSLSLESIRRQEAGFARFAVAPDLRRCLATAWAAHDHACADPGLDVIECTDWGLLAAPWLAGGERAVAITLHGSMGQIDWFDPRPGRELEGTLLRLLEPPVLRAAAALSTPGAPNAASWSALLGCEVEWAAPPLTLADVDAPATASRPARAGLVVGRIQRWKGPETLCEALSRLGQAAPEVQWVGRDMPWGPAPSASRHLAARYPSVWGPLVRPLGARPLAEVRRLQREAAFVVIPSTWDVFNYTSTEALAAGAVVICSDGAGAASLITDGVDGFVFPAGDAAALA
ncbi:MAG: glycosyltransferase family 4 protein, partial [Planctomycetota bacterium]|nr:glycosyltransferase family 4 protein [Planctomycetota bacterium]